MSHAAETQGASAGILPSFKRLLLVTDFSTCSEAAAPFARWIAESYGASISVAHVIPGDLVKAPSQAVFGSPEELAAVAERNMRAFTERNALLGAEIVITAGVVWDAMGEIIGHGAIDLVVVGTHGRSGVGKLLMGSVAQRIFNVAPCPVLTVSSRMRQSGRDPRLRKVLYATDFSRQSLHALPYALSLAKSTGFTMLLVHVLGSDAAPVGSYPEFQERLGELVPEAAREWCQAEKLVLHGDPAHAIVQAAAERGAELIVIGARKIEEGPMYRVNVPLTTAYQIVAHAPCPVLRVRS